MGLVVQAGSAHMGRRGDRDQALLFGVAIEAGNGAQPAGDRGPGATQGLEVAGETLDVGATRPEHRHPVFGAPGDVLAQVEGVGVASQTAVAGQEPGQRQLLAGAEQLVSRHERSACRDGNVHGWNLQASSRGSNGRDRSSSPSNRHRPPTVRPGQRYRARAGIRCRSVGSLRLASEPAFGDTRRRPGQAGDRDPNGGAGRFLISPAGRSSCACQPSQRHSEQRVIRVASRFLAPGESKWAASGRHVVMHPDPAVGGTCGRPRPRVSRRAGGARDVACWCQALARRRRSAACARSASPDGGPPSPSHTLYAAIHKLAAHAISCSMAVNLRLRMS
jgi:hypothetical protein